MLPAHPERGSTRRKRIIALVVLAVAVLLFLGRRTIVLLLTTVSTDDAYVNSHVTFVAARVPGQVTKVFVDDNYRVRKGDLIVQLDKEPYQIQLELRQAQYETAEANLEVAKDEISGIVAQARSNRFKLQHAIEDVNDQIALLRAKVAQLDVERANLVFAVSDFERVKGLIGKGAVSQQEFDRAKAALDVAKNRVTAAEQDIQQVRANLGLPINAENPLDVPADLDQTFSTVRQALATLLASVAPLGIRPSSYNLTPDQMVEEFYRRDPERNIDRIYARLMESAPAIKQAEAQLESAKADLDQAKLNLRYCDVYAEIDGQVTRRNVNPGNNIQAGQSLMAIRSLTEIWIDANYKETQLADLAIGQRVEVHVDMYGRQKIYEGRITGFTMGTGSTLALLPAQNATGNFIKVVQRLPVRIELTDYDPEKDTLFVGLSVEPYVFIHEPATGAHAGQKLQALLTEPLRDREPAAEVPGAEKPAASKPETSPPATAQPSASPAAEQPADPSEAKP